jgi:hypothetical protein
MRDYSRQAITALRTYLERGKQILRFLGDGHYEKADVLLRKRKAAFHNFRVADVLASVNQEHLQAEPEMLLLWRLIQAQNVELNNALERSGEKTKESLLAIRESRQKLRKYHSGTSDNNNIQHSV